MEPVKMWKRPPRREYAPKQYDSGQPISWTREIPGRWTGPKWGEGEWIPGEEVTRHGTIWSPAQRARQLWVVPDGSKDYILVELPSPRDIRWARGVKQCTWDTSWVRDTLRRVEHLRGYSDLHGVVQEEHTYYSHVTRQQETIRTLRWHTDPKCPDAQGKKPVPYWERLTARQAIGELTGENGYPHSSGEKFCSRCVLLETPDETAEAS